MKNGINYLMGNPITKKFGEKIYEDNKKSLIRTLGFGADNSGKIIPIISGDSSCPAFNLFRMVDDANTTYEQIYYKFLMTYRSFIPEKTWCQVHFTHLLESSVSEGWQISFENYIKSLVSLDKYQEKDSPYHYSKLINHDIEKIYDELHLMYLHNKEKK